MDNTNKMVKLKNITVDKIFLYSQDEYNRINRKEFIKSAIKSIICISVYAIGYWIIKYGSYNLLAITSSVMVIDGIFFMFPYVTKTLSFLSEVIIYQDRCYIITKNQRLISVKLINKDIISTSSYRSRGNIITHTLRMYLYNKSNQSFQNKIKNYTKEDLKKLVETENIFSYYELINVYKIKELNDCLEINCDYIDMRGQVHKKEEKTIFKYLDNIDVLKAYLKEKIRNPQDLTPYIEKQPPLPPQYKTKGKGHAMSIFGYVMPIFFILLAIFESSYKINIIAFCLSLGVAYLIPVCYYLKYLIKKADEYQQFYMNKRLRTNKIVLGIYLIIISFCLLFSKDQAFTVLLLFLIPMLISSLSVLFLKKYIKKQIRKDI